MPARRYRSCRPEEGGGDAAAWPVSLPLDRWLPNSPGEEGSRPIAREVFDLMCVEAKGDAVARRDSGGSARGKSRPRRSPAHRADARAVKARIDRRGCSGRQLAETFKMVQEHAG